MLSRFDTFGMAALEAMAASLPVIVSGNVGAKDLVRNGENGFTVSDPSETDAVASLIKTMLQDDMRDKMGQEAGNIAGRYSWDMTVAQIQSVYDQIISEKHEINKR
jgi:glycosyltransferase involved in cell wall biosynthesis